LLDLAEQEQQADTKATVGFLLDRYLELVELSPTTRPGYEGYVRRTLKPALGEVQIRRERASTLEQFYARLRLCSELCDGRLAGRKVTQVRRWRDREKEVPDIHRCRPLATSTVHQLNSILSGAFEMAIRWEWLSRNPARQAKLPRLVRHEPEPPEPKEIGRMLDHAWAANPALAVYIWLAAVSGARRGELCGWRWSRLDLDGEDPSLTVARNYAVGQGQRIEKATKTHATRRMATDEITRELLVEHRQRCEASYAAAGLEMPEDGFVFSNDGGGPRGIPTG
jgi:integrase